MPLVEPLHPDPELVTLLRAAYAVEARLIGHAIPIGDVMGLRWWGCRETVLRAAVGVSETAELVDVERLVVAPEAFRRGLGSALVAHVVAHAAGRRVVVATGRDNGPARRLYERAGFGLVGQDEVAPGLWVVRYALSSAAPPSAGRR